MSNYKIQKVVGTTNQLDIQDYFSLKVKSVSGMANIGAVKGVVKESYVDAAGERIYIHKVDGEVLVDATEFSLEVLFLDSRYEKFLAFIKYLQGEEVYIIDTDRNIKVKGWALSATDPTDFVEDGNEYLLSTIKFTNVYGKFELIK